MDHCSSGLSVWIPVASTLLGVIVGAGLSSIQRWHERKMELRSVLQALLWELQDARRRLSLPTAVFETPIPSVDTLLSRGLLYKVPEKVRGPVLAVRSLVQLHTRHLEQYERDRHAYDPATNEYEVVTLTGLAKAALAGVDLAVGVVRRHLGKHAVSRRFPINVPGEPGTGTT